MVVPLVAVSMVVVPVASRATAVALMPPVAMISLIAVPTIMPVPGVMPLPFIVMAPLPLPTPPITMSVIVPVAIPAWTNDDNTRRFCINGRGRRIDRRRCVLSTGDANVYSNIDMRQASDDMPMPKPVTSVIANKRLRKMVMICLVRYAWVERSNAPRVARS